MHGVVVSVERKRIGEAASAPLTEEGSLDRDIHSLPPPLVSDDKIVEGA